MARHMENYNSMSKDDKEYALTMEIRSEESYQEMTSNPMTMRRRRKYIKELKQQLYDLKKPVKKI